MVLFGAAIATSQNGQLAGGTPWIEQALQNMRDASEAHEEHIHQALDAIK